MSDDDLDQRLATASVRLAGLGSTLQERENWPLADRFDHSPEASWGPRETLAHLEEMLPFWLGEAERILDGPPDAPVPFGRTADDPIRIGVIGRDRGIPVRELFARIAVDSARTARRMREMTDAESARAGVHPTRGELTVAALFERFVTGHIEGHVDQLREILESQGA